MILATFLVGIFFFLCMTFNLDGFSCSANLTGSYLATCSFFLVGDTQRMTNGTGFLLGESSQWFYSLLLWLDSFKKKLWKLFWLAVVPAKNFFMRLKLFTVILIFFLKLLLYSVCGQCVFCVKLNFVSLRSWFFLSLVTIRRIQLNRKNESFKQNVVDGGRCSQCFIDDAWFWKNCFGFWRFWCLMKLALLTRR